MPNTGISKPTSFIKPLFVALVLLNLSIILGASYGIYKSRQQAEQQAAINTQNLTQVIEKSISGLVDKIDIVLQVSIDEINRQRRQGRIAFPKVNEFLRQQQQRVPDLFNLRVTDKNGDLIYGSDFSELPQVNYADRDYYLELRDNPQAGLFIAQPVFGKTTQKWLLTFARRINNPDASFAGVLYGTIALEHFSQLFTIVEVGAKGAIALKDDNLRLIARYPELQSPSGNVGSQKLSVPFEQALKTNPTKGTYRSDATSIDNVIRTHSYLKLEKYPFYINVGLAENDYLTTWRKEAWSTALLVVAFLLLSTVFSAVLIRSLRRQQSDAEKLHALFELSPLGIVLNDLGGRHVEFNQAFCRICGYSANELRHLNYRALTARQNEAQDAAQLKSLALNGHYGPYDMEYQRKDGSLVPVRLNGMLIPGSDGQRYIWSIVEDITERKRAEHEIEQYFRLFNTASDLMCIADPQGCFKKVNPAFIKTLGYAESELLSKPFIDFVHPDDRQLTFDETVKQLQSGLSIRFENRYICKDESIRVLLWHAYFDKEQNLTYATATDITEAKKSEEMIWKQANFDPLTGLPNRQMVYGRLEQEIKKSDREDKPLAVMFIDLDRFKEINDTLGHEIGDLLLKEASQRMTCCVRETDMVGRLGGDEFVIILSELDNLNSIGRIASTILDNLITPFRLGVEMTHISASIGIALYPTDATDLVTLLKSADQAMYAAKQQGKNRFNYYTSAMQEIADSRMRMINELYIAVADQQFIVHYQPIVEMATGAIYKAEALVRWQHPQRGLVSPLEFIALTEEIGMIVGIGNWIFQQAAVQTVQLRTNYHPDFQISVNMSPIQFMADRDKHAQWFDHLNRLDLPPGGIVIEITESFLMEANPEIGNQLLTFRDHGMQVAIDDFGTGYSSLAYLRNFDIDYLKIDKSFVNNLVMNANDLALCEAIIVMAHKLGIKVIAEGVETQDQFDLLKQIECDYGQGFLWSKPLASKEFETFLESTGSRSGQNQSIVCQ